jgi:hypothetical protein
MAADTELALVDDERFDAPATPPTAAEKRALEDVEMRRAAATSGKGNPPSAIDEFRARQPIKPGTPLALGTVIKDSEAPFHPSPAIHEGRIQALEAFETCGDYLQPALNFLSSARVALEQVDQAHTALLKDTSKTPEARVMLLSGPASKKFDALYASCIKTQETIIKQIQHTEVELSKPLTTAAMTDAHKELRIVLREMPKAERHKVIEQSIQSGDESVITAVLGSHPLATTVDPIQHQVWTRRVNEKRNGEAVRRLDAMKKSLEIVSSVVPLIAPQFEAAMRGSFKKAAAVRGLSEASQKALDAILGQQST